jgi:hypothetical protein
VNLVSDAAEILLEPEFDDWESRDLFDAGRAGWRYSSALLRLSLQVRAAAGVATSVPVTCAADISSPVKRVGTPA